MGAFVGFLRFRRGPGEDRPDRDVIEPFARRAGGSGFADRGLSVVHIPATRTDPKCHDRAPNESCKAFLDGALYNADALRTELNLSERLRDEELLARFAADWGTELVAKLHGPFAAAVWDGEREELILCRDRLGERGLFYHLGPAGLVFGSRLGFVLEMIEALGLAPRPELHLDAVHDYLTFGRFFEPDTGFRGIQALPPAHYLVVDGFGSSEILRYWSMPAAIEQAPRFEAELAKQLLDGLRAAVAAAVPRDQSPAVLLDDDSIAPGLLDLIGESDRGPITIVRFAAGPGHPPSVVDGEVTIGIGPHLLARLPELIRSQAQPITEPATLALGAAAEQAAGQGIALCTALGASPLLLGNPQYFRLRHAVRESADTSFSRTASLYRLGAGPSERKHLVWAYGALVGHFTEEDKLVGYGDALLPLLRTCSYDRLLAHVDYGVQPEELGSRIDLSTSVPRAVSEAAAAVAPHADLRAPFLHPDFVEFIQRVPPHQLAWNEQPMALWQRILPTTGSGRAGVSHGAPVRFADLVDERARRTIASLLLDGSLVGHGLLRPAFLRSLIADDRRGRRENGARIWLLLSLEMWLRIWLDRTDPGQNPFSFEPAALARGGGQD